LKDDQIERLENGSFGSRRMMVDSATFPSAIGRADQNGGSISSANGIDTASLIAAMPMQQTSVAHALEGRSTFSKLWISVLLFVWFSSCVVGTLVNKRLMDVFAYPSTLTAIHLFTGAMIDVGLLYGKGTHVLLSRRMLLVSAPVAAALCFGKTLTFMSYVKVPASLTHTVKVCRAVLCIPAPTAWSCCITVRLQNR